jgi:hypothetical protein
MERLRQAHWRCKTFRYGRGPETEFSDPGLPRHGASDMTAESATKE